MGLLCRESVAGYLTKVQVVSAAKHSGVGAVFQSVRERPPRLITPTCGSLAHHPPEARIFDRSSLPLTQ
jgi:hypothetical protein